MVRWRGNQPYPGGREADFGDPGVDLAAREFSAFAGLGTLGHLDLQFLGLREVIAGDPKPPRGHLFDGAIARIAIGIGDIARRIFPAFPGIALAANTVHGNGQGLVRFLADRAVGHGTGFEAWS